MRILLMFVALMLATLQGFAGGRIAGKVTDGKTGEPVIGATIIVKGTAAGASSDVDGNFIINVDAGTYTVAVKYIGYQGKEIEDVKVAEGGSATVNVAISEVKSTELKEVVVRSSIKKENINALYTVQKNAASVSDGISADIIKRSPDRSTGEVLKRVSGTTVQDNKFIVVRGLNERYNTSLLNSAFLPSTEPDKKAFSFDLIPANLIDNVVIYKTATPDLPGDFSGGAVRVTTKDFPDRRLMDVSVGLSYNDMTTFKDYYTGDHKGSLDALGFLDKSRNLPGAFPSKESYLNLPIDQQVKITQQFPDQFGYKKAGSSLPGMNLQFTNGNTYHRKNGDKFGYIFSVGYRNSRRYSEGSRDDYDIAQTHLYHYDNKFYSTTANLGSILNLNYTFGKNKISLKNFFNNDFRNSITTRMGANYERSADQPLFIKSYSEEVSQNGIYNSTLEGSHALGKGDATKIDWNASYAHAYRNSPDQKIVTMVQDLQDGTPDHPYYIKLNNINSPAIKDAGRVYSDLKEDIFNGGVDFSQGYKLFGLAQKFKAGALFVNRERTVDVTALGYASSKFSGQTIYETPDRGLSNLFSLQQQSTYDPPILLANILTNSIDYTGRATLEAGYLMSESKFTDHLRAVFGARLESFEQVMDLGNTEVRKQNTDVLPSVNLTYELTSKTNLRLSGFQAVNRPEFREFAPYRYYDYDNDFIVAGNPDLKRSVSTNLDLRYELYPSAGEIVSASLFYKHFKDPIEQVNQGNNVLTYDNVPSAQVYGVEVELRKKLGFLGAADWLDNLSYYLNAAYIKGSVDLPGKSGASTLLQGQSPYILNTGLSYITKNEGLTFNLLYNRIGERIKFRGQGFADIWEKSRDVIDFQVGKRLMNNKAEVKLTLSDLLAQPQAYYYKYGSGTNYKEGIDKKITSYTFGRTVTLSFRYSF